MGNKWVMICVTHAQGCRYQAVERKKEQFHPEYH